MGSVEVLFQLGDGDVEVDVLVFMEDAGDEVDEDAIGRVLVSSELYFHGPELHPPADVIIDGYFQPDRVPVGAVQHVEQGELIVIHLFVVLVAHDVISSEDVGQVED